MQTWLQITSANTTQAVSTAGSVNSQPWKGRTMNSPIAQIFMAVHGLLLWLFLATWGLAGWFAGSLIRDFRGNDGATVGLVIGLAIGLVWAVIIFGPSAVLIQVYRDNRRLSTQVGVQLEILQATLKHHGIPFDEARIADALRVTKSDAATPPTFPLSADAQAILLEPEVIGQHTAMEPRKQLRQDIVFNRYKRPEGSKSTWSRNYGAHTLEIFDDGTVSIRGETFIFAFVLEAIRLVDKWESQRVAGTI